MSHIIDFNLITSPEKSSILTDEEDESNKTSEIEDNSSVAGNETIENGVENV